MESIEKTISFVETASQVHYLLNSSGLKIDMWIALEPDAAFALMKQDIKYKKLEDFYSEKELWDRSESILEQQTKWVDWIDDYLSNRIPKFKEFNFRPANSHFYFLKIMSDALHMRAFALEKFYNKVKPKRIFFFNSNNELKFNLFLYFPVSIYSLLIPHWASQNNIKFQGIDQNWSSKENSLLNSKGVNIFKKIEQTIYKIIRKSPKEIIKKSKELFFEIFYIRKKQDISSVVVLHKGYDVNCLKNDLHKRGLNLINWVKWAKVNSSSSQLISKEEKLEIENTLYFLWDDIKNYKKLYKPFFSSEIDMSEIALIPLEFWWKKGIVKEWETFFNAYKIFSKKSPRCIVTSIIRDLAPVLQAARNKNIPTIMYQHGSNIGKNLIWDWLELAYTDYNFCHGEGRAKYLLQRREKYNDHRAKPIAIGSVRLDEIVETATQKRINKIRKKICRDPEIPIVIYIPNHLTGYLRYLSGGSYPDVSYFELQFKILKIFKNFPNIHFIYKAFADKIKNPINDIIENYPEENIDIIKNQDYKMSKLNELVWAVDAIIIDYPSTALIEACLTQKQIISFADKKSVPLDEDTKILLKKRVIFTETTDDYLLQINKFLSEGDFSEISNPDLGLLRMFGTHLNNNRALDRAIDKICEIIE